MGFVFIWWMAPIAIMVLGILYALFDGYTSKGILGGMNGVLMLGCCIVASVFLTIGHFL